VRTLLRLLSGNRDFRLLVSAGLVSMTGDWILGIGLTYLVYSITGSTLASGGMLLASVLPSILLGSVAGVLVDRWDRRRTMVVTNVLQVVGLIPLLFVHSEATIWIVYLVAAYQGIVEQFFGPAEQALVPHLVPEGELLAANGLNSQIRNAARLVGSGAGGVIAAFAGIAGLAVVDAASFAIAAALLSAIRYRAAAHAEPSESLAEHASPGALARLLEEWRDGLAVCAQSLSLRVVLFFTAITSVGEGVMGTLFAPFVRDVLHGSGTAYGAIVGIQAVGGIVGGVCVAMAGERWSAYALFGFGALAFGLIDLALFLYPLVLSGVAPALVCMLVVGVPGACAIAGLMTTFQTSTTDRFCGRVWGAITAVQGCSFVIGIGVASWLGEVVGIVPIIAIQGGGAVVAALMVLVALRDSAARRVHVEAEVPPADPEPVPYGS
jgi:Na+/melibiose symporter-like transporter